MKIVCELCGGSVFEKKGDLFVCKSCGTSYSSVDIKKLMVDDGKEVLNSDAIANDSKIERFNELISLATNYYHAGEDDKAYDALIQATSVYEIGDKHWSIDSLGIFTLVDINKVSTDYSIPEYSANVISELTSSFNIVENYVDNYSETNNKVGDLINYYCSTLRPTFDRYFTNLKNILGDKVTGKQLRSNVDPLYKIAGGFIGDIVRVGVSSSRASKMNKENERDVIVSACLFGELNNDVCNEIINYSNDKEKPDDFNETMTTIANNTISYLNMLNVDSDKKQKLITDAEQIKNSLK